MSGLIYVYITAPSSDEARRIARHLLEGRLIACANILPIASMYWWEGAIEEAAEAVLIAKTTADRYESVRAEVERIHPYSVPCIVQFSVAANPAYEKWLRESLVK